MNYDKDALAAAVITKRQIENRLTMWQVGEAVGVRAKTIWKVENRLTVNEETFTKICAWLKKEPGEFFKKEGMKKFYFTCGQAHRHELENGYVWDEYSIIEVASATKKAAVDFVFEKFGKAWVSVYDEPQGLEFAANGIVASYIVKETPELTPHNLARLIAGIRQLNLGQYTVVLRLLGASEVLPPEPMAADEIEEFCNKIENERLDKGGH